MKVNNRELFTSGDKGTFAYKLVAAWHSYRLPILVAAAILLLTIWISLVCQRSRRLKQPLTPPLSPPVDAKTQAITKEVVAGKTPPQFQLCVQAPNSPPDKSAGPTADKVNLRRPAKPKRVHGSRVRKGAESGDTNETTLQPLIFFFSLTGSTEKAARQLAKEFRAFELGESERTPKVLIPEVHDLSYVDYDDYFIGPPKPDISLGNVTYFYVFLIPTYNIDTQLNILLEHLQETHHDFRINTAPLCKLAGYSVFGFGDKEGWETEDEGFCSQAIEIDRWMAKLSGKRRASRLVWETSNRMPH